MFSKTRMSWVLIGFMIFLGGSWATAQPNWNKEQVPPDVQSFALFQLALNCHVDLRYRIVSSKQWLEPIDQGQEDEYFSLFIEALEPGTETFLGQLNMVVVRYFQHNPRLPSLALESLTADAGLCK